MNTQMPKNMLQDIFECTGSELVFTEQNGTDITHF